MKLFQLAQFWFGLLWFVQIFIIDQVFLRCFRDPIRVPRIENRVPRIKEIYHQVRRIRENRVPRIRIGSLQVHTGHLTFSLKKTRYMQIWMTLFQFHQMFLIVPNFEWSCFNYPNMIKAVGICPNVFKCMQI